MENISIKNSLQTLRLFLYPFSLIFGLIIRLRNLLFDLKILPSTQFQIPVIGIGNLSVGGTGKTPFVIYLSQFLAEQNLNVAVLSRGYGRKTNGFIELNSSHVSDEVGDEPLMIFKRTGMPVFVCEDRVKGIKEILNKHPEINAIVLDDCFQHRKLRAGFYVLLSDFSRPYFKDKMMPTGNLREPKSGIKRANVIVFTKAPMNLLQSVKNKYEKEGRVGGKNIYFTGLDFQNLIPCNEVATKMNPVDVHSAIAFCGIANPDSFFEYVNSIYSKFIPIGFNDHHNFSEKDIQRIIDAFKVFPSNCIMITTEKDYCRLSKSNLKLLKDFPLFYLPVNVLWDADEKRNFEGNILQYVRTNKVNG